MIGLALSGGGSRAIAFHLGCLRALNDLGILERVKIISTISGGSLIGAYFVYTPKKSFSEFDSDICKFLSQGFQNKILLEFLKPKNISSSCINYLTIKSLGLLNLLFKKNISIHRYPSFTDMFQKVLQKEIFSNLKMSSPRRYNMDIVIGACELRTGTAFRFGNTIAGGWRYGAMVDWDVEVGFASAASAAYPIFLPAFDRTFNFCKDGKEMAHRILISDGGIYDNLGIQVIEPNRNSQYSLHTFPCDYLIICNAGHGQDTGFKVPLSWKSRVTRSMEIVHRRVQDSAMNRLHFLKQTDQIKGFIMPYLGQQDGNLPWKPSNLVLRSEILDYPTDFAPMSGKWIELLTRRGEQLTRGLADYYLSSIL